MNWRTVAVMLILIPCAVSARNDQPFIVGNGSVWFTGVHFWAFDEVDTVNYADQYFVIANTSNAVIYVNNFTKDVDYDGWYHVGYAVLNNSGQWQNMSDKVSTYIGRGKLNETLLNQTIDNRMGWNMTQMANNVSYSRSMWINSTVNDFNYVKLNDSFYSGNLWIPGWIRSGNSTNSNIFIGFTGTTINRSLTVGWAEPTQVLNWSGIYANGTVEVRGPNAFLKTPNIYANGTRIRINATAGWGTWYNKTDVIAGFISGLV
jgi:hypothetical protein